MEKYLILDLGKNNYVKKVIQLINSLIKKGRPIFGQIKLRKEEKFNYLSQHKKG